VNLFSIDLNLLLVLHTVLEEKSVARAAEKLSVTPPAVSNSLARLRSILGDPLLVRRGRNLTPTPRALELEPRIKVGLSELSAALEPEFDPSTTTRRFALALSEPDQASSAPEIAAALARRMPQAVLQIVNLDTVIASDGLASGTADAAMAPAPVWPKQRDTYARALYDEEGVLLVRKTHPIARRGRLSVAQFNALRHVDVWLVLGRPSLGHRVADDYFARNGMRRVFALIVSNFFTAAMVAASSDLATAVPRRLAEQLRAMLPLRILTFPGPGLRFQQQLIWHERTHRDPGATMLRELVTEVMSRPRRSVVPSDHSGSAPRRKSGGQG
jgi:DNA-binding transcriptional LysR family regulator